MFNFVANAFMYFFFCQTFVSLAEEVVLGWLCFTPEALFMWFSFFFTELFFVLLCCCFNRRYEKIVHRSQSVHKTKEAKHFTTFHLRLEGPFKIRLLCKVGYSELRGWTKSKGKYYVCPLTSCRREIRSKKKNQAIWFQRTCWKGDGNGNSLIYFLSLRIEID